MKTGSTGSFEGEVASLVAYVCDPRRRGAQLASYETITRCRRRFHRGNPWYPHGILVSCDFLRGAVDRSAGMLSEPNCEQESCQDSTILHQPRFSSSHAAVLFIRIRGKNNPWFPCLPWEGENPGPRVYWNARLQAFEPRRESRYIHTCSA